MQPSSRQHVALDQAARSGHPSLLADQGLAIHRPQDHGMNPGVLVGIDDQAKVAFPGLRSVLVVRGGDLVVER